MDVTTIAKKLTNGDIDTFSWQDQCTPFCYGGCASLRPIEHWIKIQPIEVQTTLDQQVGVRKVDVMGRTRCEGGRLLSVHTP
jgi:hypothetical protein